VTTDPNVITTTALARSGGDSPLPVFSGKQVAEALAAYHDLQQALDKAMPDQIMDLDGKKFRKKGYWRAVGVAFNISVETTDEHRQVSGAFKDGHENFGYVISKRATAPNGRSVSADGTCFAVEKARRFKCPHLEELGSKRTVHFPHNTCPDFDPEFQWRVIPGEATEHNIRGHASTRATNRAISDLVGFGEVSAEEVVRSEDHPVPTQSAPSASVNGWAQHGATTVKAVVKKSGTNARGPWTRYTVQFEDGRSGGTFSKGDGEHAERAKASGALVIPKLNKTEKGFDLIGFEPFKKPDVEATHAPDEPVTGPEKVLTVRKVATEQGERFIINTEKRVLVSDRVEHANVATKARSGKCGIVPVFEVVAGREGHAPVNKLLSLMIAEEAAQARQETREPGQDG